MPVVRSQAVQGNLLNSPVQPCPTRALIAVTVQYPLNHNPPPAHDVEVKLVGPHPLVTVSSYGSGNVITFAITGSSSEGDYRVRLVSNHWSTLLGTSYVAEAKCGHHATVNIVLHRRPALAITCTDHHFAPGVEELRATYTSTNHASDTLNLTVTGTNAGGHVVYRRDNVSSADGAHSLAQGGRWDGTANTGALDGQPITPLHSPYTIRIEADGTGVVATAQFHVLYHSVTLALGTYTANG